GKLDEQRDERDVAEVPTRHVATWPAWEERLAFVTGDDHERPVVDVRRAQSAEQDAERLVRVRELQQVTLLGLERQPAVLRPVAVERSGNHAHVARVPLSRGQE